MIIFDNYSSLHSILKSDGTISLDFDSNTDLMTSMFKDNSILPE